MATIATMAMLKPAKILARSAPSTSGSNKAPSISLRSLQKGAAKKGGLAVSSPAAAAMAGAFFSALASSDAALAAQQIADVAADAGSDNRGTLLLVVVAPAIGWVLYNILQPALNQLNRMRSQALIAGLGLGAAATAALACAPEASAVQELAAVAAAAPADDNRGLLLLIVVAPAIGWVLFNILQPALNQLNRMRSD
ncbi:photosystem II reaction center proteins PsbY, chloroplastic-like [Phragmites australis]|uniref:photosystem II reaction center proteins PsbY, chloroplastic-like n=1 Tax=Phragmites australis TaxID=29695 RepID=UPI002D77764D|nr:photosystem II reaction center proteins PsbY, chloroplastic-like [Phragmites australis]XP_062192087.1 photosystem II reaction center proteins PsbY, chloroplastic-like [Phragmites australis]